MSRKSSMGVVQPGAPDERAATRASEFLGYEPTPGQRLVKASYWSAWREDPSVDPASVTPQHVLAAVDAPSIDKWWRDAGFRDWFLNKEEWRGKAEAAIHLWLDQTYRRLSTGMMQDKDLAAAGKLLGEMTGRMPRGGAAQEAAKQPRQLTESQARQAIERAASSMGWTPPAVLPPAPADEPGTDE